MRQAERFQILVTRRIQTPMSRKAVKVERVLMAAPQAPAAMVRLAVMAALPVIVAQAVTVMQQVSSVS